MYRRRTPRVEFVLASSQRSLKLRLGRSQRLGAGHVPVIEVALTVEDLSRTLPNGFHDAEFRTILLDYTARRAVIELSLWMGDMEGPKASRETYRDAELAIESLP